MSPSEFQSQSWLPYSRLVQAYMLHAHRDSPLVRHLLTSWRPVSRISDLIGLKLFLWKFWELFPCEVKKTILQQLKFNPCTMSLNIKNIEFLGFMSAPMFSSCLGSISSRVGSISTGMG